MTSGRNPHGENVLTNSAIVLPRTGSEPLQAARQLRKSSFSFWDSLTLRTQRSYAKFGTADSSPRYFVMAFSHLTGRWMKLAGGMKTHRAPVNTVKATTPIRPMSWKIGNQETTVGFSDWRNRLARTRTLWAMLACDTITPFGSPVDPD